jgi:uncharacterized repeat protein (TIGR03837 family)
MAAAPRWDIFCKVVDNFGDIGVCWRLARQLAAEHGLAVRLWVDDLASLARLAPAIDPNLDAQDCAGVKVRHWDAVFPAELLADGLGDVVIEAFGCDLPEACVVAMARRSCKPVWINLEYLSAENWVRGCHGLASPHPRLPLNKYFFFPGFFAGTGGLLRERDLLAQRDDFLADPAAQAWFWAELGVPTRRPGEQRISLFGYRNAATSELLAAWSAAETPVLCLVPEGPAALEAAAWAGQADAKSGAVWRRGALELRILAFVEQECYDRLLWACDCNFVRGEDSFVRAQWAGRPMVWQIYPQQEDAHWLKLDAFLELYCAGLPAEAATAAGAMFRAWNQGADAGRAWTGYRRHHAALADHARRWAPELAQHQDLTAVLVEFCGLRLQ